MTPRELQQAILSSDLLPSEKLVGLVVAIHLNASTGKTRLRRSTIADSTGLSVTSVKRAVQSLVKARLITRQTTGRSAIFSIHPAINNTCNVDGSPMTHQTGHEDTLSHPSRYTLDTEFSTRAEEQHKLEEASIRRGDSNILFDCWDIGGDEFNRPYKGE